MNKDDRNYDPEEIEVDERFIYAKKDMITTFSVQIAYTALMIFTAYFFSKGDPSEMMMIGGIPGWWVMCLVITAVFIGIIYVLTHKVYKNVDVDAYLDDACENEEKAVN